MIVNLVTNSAHAMRGRAGRIELAVEADASPPLGPGAAEAPSVRLIVRDDGHGMDAATRERIFEPFFTTKAPGEGSGLGLSVVFGIVKEHGGAIAVESTPGAGTEVSVWLPGVRGEEEPAATPPEAPAGNGRLVAVIDDERPVGKAAAEILRGAGYRVRVFEDPDEALVALTSAPRDYAVVITDLTMPRRSGLEIVRSVRALPGGPSVILMTGHDPGSAEREAGVRLVISKPFTAAELRAAVARALA